MADQTEELDRTRAGVTQVAQVVDQPAAVFGLTVADQSGADQLVLESGGERGEGGLD